MSLKANITYAGGRAQCPELTQAYKDQSGDYQVPYKKSLTQMAPKPVIDESVHKNIPTAVSCIIPALPLNTRVKHNHHSKSDFTIASNWPTALPCGT